VGKDWTPGDHTAAVTWDGKNDLGRPFPPGQYRLFAKAITTTTRDVACADGSGSGIKKFSGTHEAAGLRRFRIGPVPAGSCPRQIGTPV
jgi:hypothetical protein